MRASIAGNNGLESVDTGRLVPSQPQYPKPFPGRYPNLAVKLISSPAAFCLSRRQWRNDFAREYVLRQHQTEPKLTWRVRAEDSVREQCQKRTKLMEIYAHCSKSKAHGPIRSQPRRCRHKRIVGPFS